MMQRTWKQSFELWDINLPGHSYGCQKQSRNVDAPKNLKCLFQGGFLQLSGGAALGFCRQRLSRENPKLPWTVRRNSSGTFGTLSEKLSTSKSLTNRITKTISRSLDTHPPVLPKSSGCSQANRWTVHREPPRGHHHLARPGGNPGKKKEQPRVASERRVKHLFILSVPLSSALFGLRDFCTTCAFCQGSQSPG